MATAKISRFPGIISLLITIFSLSLPAYAQYSGGTGEPNDPYQIATAEDLMLLGDTPEDYDKHFILTADIDLDPNLPGRKVFDRAVIAPDMNDVNWDFQGNPFTGILDGNGHVISNLHIQGGGYLGLFGQLYAGARVEHLGVVDFNINGSGSRVGGLAGDNFGDVTGCFGIGTVSGDKLVGGLVGRNGVWSITTFGKITSCHIKGTITGSSQVGGLVPIQA